MPCALNKKKIYSFPIRACGLPQAMSFDKIYMIMCEIINVEWARIPTRDLSQLLHMSLTAQ